MKFIVFTHSSYNDIYKINQDHLLKLDISHEDIVIFTDKQDSMYIFKTYIYDDSKLYHNRIKECFEQIEDKTEYGYFIFFHDNDIFLSLDMKKIEKLKKLMIQNDLSRIQFNLYSIPEHMKEDNRCEECYYRHPCKIHSNKFVVDDDISILENKGYYVYSVSTSMWRLNSYLDIIYNTLDCDYYEVETPANSYFILKGYKCYSIISKFYNNYFNRIYSSCINIIHLTCRGKFIIENDFSKNIYNTYSIKRDIYTL